MGLDSQPNGTLGLSVPSSWNLHDEQVRCYDPRDVADPSTIGDPLLGRIIADKYRLDAVAGAGSFGTVYRAVHVVLDRLVAVKVLNPALMANPDARARFRREARAASKLDHPNSVQVLDYGIEPDGLTYLVMEFLQGRELYQVIYDDWPLSSERIVKIMTQVLSVLAAAHDQGIVHRDLKPENIMLVTRPDETGKLDEVVKVTDFGIAKSIAGTVSEESMNLTREGIVHGTPEYMAPEQARGEPLDGRADLYACGVILYEMLTGSLPFTGDTPFDVILKHLSEPVIPPSVRRPDVDPRLEPIVLRALSKRREDRYPDARAMRAALLEALEQPLRVPLGARSDRVPSRPRRADPRAATVAAHGICPPSTAGGTLIMVSVRDPDPSPAVPAQPEPVASTSPSARPDARPEAILEGESARPRPWLIFVTLAALVSLLVGLLAWRLSRQQDGVAHDPLATDARSHAVVGERFDAMGTTNFPDGANVR